MTLTDPLSHQQTTQERIKSGLIILGVGMLIATSAIVLVAAFFVFVAWQTGTIS